jgi:hypothetical protein
MRRIVLAGIGTCLLIGVALLPVEPREPSRRYYSDPERRIASQVQTAERFLEILELRDSVLTSIRGDSRPSVLSIDDRIPERFRRALAAAVRSQMDRVVTDDGATLAVLVHLSTGNFGIVQVVPEVTDGRTCIAFVHLGRHYSEAMQEGRGPWPHLLMRIRREGLGACAFYAAFGSPGPHMADWLEQWAYLPAGDLDWNGDPLTGGEPIVSPLEGGRSVLPMRGGDLTFLGCAAGDLAGCREAIGSRPGKDRLPAQWADFRPPGVAATGGRFEWGSRQPLGPWTDAYLGDMVGHFGRDTFRRFWASNDSLHAAFAAATGEDLDEWTMQWARAYIGTPESGNRVPLGSAVSAVVLMGVLVVAAVGFALRRQVV